MAHDIGDRFTSRLKRLLGSRYKRPFVNVAGDDFSILQWFEGSRKITFYVFDEHTEYVREWREAGSNEFSAGHDPDDKALQKIFDWLREARNIWGAS